MKEGEYLLWADGRFGSTTEVAVKNYQRDNNLIIDGIVGEKTWSSLYQKFPNLLNRIVSKYLSEDDIAESADVLEIEIPLLKAVNEVESSGAGFIVDKPKILFEGHIFWKMLKAEGIDPKDHMCDHPSIVFSKWSKKHYLGGEREYERLELAASINQIAALKSASWGSFQVMGFNAEIIGYSSIEAFVALMESHEREHLKAMTKFLEANNLVEKLRAKNWRAFARGYNGSAYEQNKYHLKLKRAYERHKR